MNLGRPDDSIGTLTEDRMSNLRLQKMYRRAEVTEVVGLRKTQLAALIKVGDFPKPVRLTPHGRAVAWLENDLAAWQAKRVAERDAGA